MKGLNKLKYNDVIDRLQNLTMSKINTTEIANILGVPVRTLYTRSYRNSEITPIEIKKIEDFFHVNLFKNDSTVEISLMENNFACAAKVNLPSDIINIPYWEGLPEDLRTTDVPVIVPADIINKHWCLNPEKIRVVPMVGDKMANYWYRINDNDVLIIDTSHNFIRGNGVYFATSRNNTHFWVREMQALINDDIQIKSFAPSGEVTKVFTPSLLKEVDFRVIGKVVKNVSFRL